MVIDDSGSAAIEIATNVEALIAGIGPQHGDTARAPNAETYEQLRLNDPAALRTEFARFLETFLGGVNLEVDGTQVPPRFQAIDIPPVGEPSLARISRIRLETRIPADAKSVVWRYAGEFGDSIFRVRRPDDVEPYFAAYVSAGDNSAPVPVDRIIAQPAGAVFANYVAVGFAHILPKGLDHILFMIGLFLLSPRLRPLTWQVTGFTVAHSITLALGIYGLVKIPPSIVEPIIAASIIFIAVENLFTDRLQRWRPLVVFGFGLLHGLGFAGVLTEFGLPKDQYVVGLLGFNLGVEAAQLTVIGLCFATVGLSFGSRAWYRSAIVMPGSIVIAAIAAFWLAERVGSFA